MASSAVVRVTGTRQRATPRQVCHNPATTVHPSRAAIPERTPDELDHGADDPAGGEASDAAPEASAISGLRAPIDGVGIRRRPPGRRQRGDARPASGLEPERRAHRRPARLVGRPGSRRRTARGRDARTARDGHADPRDAATGRRRRPPLGEPDARRAVRDGPGRRAHPADPRSAHHDGRAGRAVDARRPGAHPGDDPRAGPGVPPLDQGLRSDQRRRVRERRPGPRLGPLHLLGRLADGGAAGGRPGRQDRRRDEGDARRHDDQARAGLAARRW